LIFFAWRLLNTWIISTAAMAQIESDTQHMRPKTERLRALRVAKEADKATNDGARVFGMRAAWGLEGIVVKRIDMPYRSGRSKDWIKARNPKAPAATRIEDGIF
jgi:hypothetical protein